MPTSKERLTAAALLNQRYLNDLQYDEDQVIEVALATGLELPPKNYGVLVAQDGTFVKPAPRELLDAVQFPDTANSGDRVLAIWLLMHGGEYSYYGGGDTSLTSKLLHVLICGAVYESDISEDTWYGFTDTFHSSARLDGLMSRFSCSCGQVEELEVRKQAESVTFLSLLRELLA